ncbi:hypothetical protein [Vibrio alginolyticus]|uniref:hypothetical protein n=1 Tax=Vibrio alginolyticus TaxID=663 RepID=UPI000720B819|nr:hypothetical protein [Vibrio alginolyticus]ALR95452.1 hypothetical protein AT730_24185 [Vibrio alginolyticus]MBY7710049.1 hypothetical protein [Vibrio alginolyticus]
MAVIVGVPNDDGVSIHNKCAITQVIGGQEITVIGYMTDECQLAFRAIWEAPFEGDSVGNISALDKTSSIAQTVSDKTSKTLWNSQQVWQGNEPPEITVTLKFVAFTNAKLEVNDPIKYLAQMISPELQNTVPVSSDGLGGRVPSDARFKIGKALNLPMRISEVSYDINAPKTRDGNFAYNTVTITAAPKQMINQSQIPNHFQ